MNIVETVVAFDHPAFDGHFDGAPILPGVVLLSLVVEAMQRPDAVVTLHQAKFLAPVRPGTALQIRSQPPVDGRIRFELHDAERCVVNGALTLTPSDGTT